MDQGRRADALRCTLSYFIQLIVKFGSDFTLLHSYFPKKTRKQIKKKYREIFETKERKMKKIENDFERERRKSFFE
jgi:hypothetical protein